MIFLKRVVFGLSLLSGGSVLWASSSTPPKQEEMAQVEESTDPFVVNPASLKDELFRNGTSVLQAAVMVQKARDQVSLERANLLPSLNLGALLFSSGQPTFFLSTIQVLVPFLLPGHWFQLAESASMGYFRANCSSAF